MLLYVPGMQGVHPEPSGPARLASETECNKASEHTSAQETECNKASEHTSAQAPTQHPGVALRRAFELLAITRARARMQEKGKLPV
eukprot:1331360-Rhodomonas_salina.5